MASRAPSLPKFEHPSRDPSRPGVNPSPSSNRPDFSSGLSIHKDRRPFRILELQREQAHRSKDEIEPTIRDLAILQELDSHRYLDRNHIQHCSFLDRATASTGCSGSSTMAWSHAGAPPRDLAGSAARPSIWLLGGGRRCLPNGATRTRGLS